MCKKSSGAKISRFSPLMQAQKAKERNNNPVLAHIASTGPQFLIPIFHTITMRCSTDSQPMH